ncbi:MAG: hypothetical protein WD623_01935 [Marinobacter sp.]|uniref:hypothetical protein n=1 Tax=Marinobacter sp. TaxID=50741 RepID=UPI0034A001B4
MSTDDHKLTHLLADLPESPTAGDYRLVAQNLLPYIHEHVPPMGEGHSITRLRFLTMVARRDLSLARLIEGHLDATQILREAQKPADSTKLYAIWASGGPSDSTVITGEPAVAKLNGSKSFCSGSDIVDRALLYVYESNQLIDVDMRTAAARNYLQFEEGQWKSAAFSETHTWTVAFDDLPITPDNHVGGYKWYFDRPGFCLGALAPAACWAGGAMGLVDAVRDRTLKDGHARAHLGAMVTSGCSMQSLLKWGAEQIDADPDNTSGSMFPTALVIRHHIERNCTDILDRFGRTLGPRPFVFETDNARRIAELNVYIRQCHAERDLEELGSYLEQHHQFLSGW